MVPSAVGNVNMPCPACTLQNGGDGIMKTLEDVLRNVCASLGLNLTLHSIVASKYFRTRSTYFGKWIIQMRVLPKTKDSILKESLDSFITALQAKLLSQDGNRIFLEILGKHPHRVQRITSRRK